MLVTVPLLFELVFITSLVVLQKKAEEVAIQSQKSEYIVATVDSLNLSIWDAARNLFYLGALNQDQFREQTNSALVTLQKQIQELDTLPVDSDEQRKNIQDYKAIAQKGVRMIQEIENELESGEVIAGRTFRNTLNYMMKTNKRFSLKILDYEQKRKANLPTQEKSARQLLEICLATGIMLNVLVCIGLARFYSKDITSRVARLVDNTSRLESGAPLSEQVSGSDEIAHLDKQFHKMAGALNAALRKEKAVFENIAEVIFTLDEALTFVRISPSVLTVLGWRPEELEGKSLLDYTPEADKEPLRREFGTMPHTGGASPISREISLRRSDEEYAWTRWTIIWAEQEQNYFCVMHDVSEQKRLEQLKQDFTSMISHDLRTPLTALELTLEMLGTGDYGELSERGVARLNRSRESLNDLLRLISDLLDIDKLDSGSYSLNKDNYYSSDLIADAIRLVESIAEKKSVEILALIRTDLYLHVDKDLVVRVLQNLLSNALKFAPESSTITISTLVHDGMGLLKVEDEGEGMTLEEQQFIFDRYFQAASTDSTTSSGGTGLGLAFCRSIVQLHGGTISVRSQKGSGTEFSFTLPLARKS